MLFTFIDICHHLSTNLTCCQTQFEVRMVPNSIPLCTEHSEPSRESFSLCWVSWPRFILNCKSTASQIIATLKSELKAIAGNGHVAKLDQATTPEWHQWCITCHINCQQMSSSANTIQTFDGCDKERCNFKRICAYKIQDSAEHRAKRHDVRPCQSHHVFYINSPGRPQEQPLSLIHICYMLIHIINHNNI